MKNASAPHASDGRAIYPGTCRGLGPEALAARAAVRAPAWRLAVADREITFTDRAEVQFRPLTAQEIASYVQSGKPMDKAGSYGIQETDFVCHICGSYHNIMGFPTEKFQQIIDSV